MSDYPSQPKLFGMGVAWVFGILAVFLVIAVGWFAISWATAPAQGKLQARQQINSGDFRIAAYDHFFDLCASVQTADNNIATQNALLAQFTKGSDDYNRTLTNIGGLESVRADGINQYNADASKSYTEGQFKASSLPWQLSTLPYHKGEQISCAS